MKVAVLALFAFTLRLNAQFAIDGRPVQIHGFVSQGFAYSNDNNYLTMPTSQGSFALTEAGLNISSQVTDKLRFGAQAYIRNVGELGKGHVTLDWASGDYRFRDWLGIRAGKVKTVLGLYNDTQDAEFLQTWALLPQSMYPTDLRETSIAHLGVDLYGSMPVHNFGRLAYTGYFGKLLNDTRGGFVIGLDSQGVAVQNITGLARGADLRISSPIPGLLLGASYFGAWSNIKGVQRALASPVRVNVFQDERPAFYAQYSRGNLRLETEYSREFAKVNVFGLFGPFGPPMVRIDQDRRSWYTAVGYRLSKHLELGAYNSRFFPDADRKDSSTAGVLPAAARHIFDQVFTARIDLTGFWDFKIEGHIIDGYGDPSSYRGFYPQENPTGFKPKTNLLVLRMGQTSNVFRPPEGQTQNAPPKPGHFFRIEPRRQLNG